MKKTLLLTAALLLGGTSAGLAQAVYAPGYTYAPAYGYGGGLYDMRLRRSMEFRTPAITAATAAPMTSTIVRASPAAAKTSVRNADARYRRRSTRQRDKTTRNERRRTFIFPRASGEGCFLLRSAMSNSDALFSNQASPFPPRGLRPGYFLRFRKNGLTRTGGVFICFPEQGKRSAETHPVPIAAPDERGTAADLFLFSSTACGEVGRGPARLSALRCGCYGRAALPGITGCKREDPPRRQCSEHLAVRSRAGRDVAQAACKARATNSARRHRTRSVSRRHR